MFYVDHMVMVCLVNKPHVLKRITRWLLLFLEYEFTVVHKPSKTHVVVDVLSKLLNNLEPLSVTRRKRPICDHHIYNYLQLFGLCN